MTPQPGPVPMPMSVPATASEPQALLHLFTHDLRAPLANLITLAQRSENKRMEREARRMLRQLDDCAALLRARTLGLRPRTVVLSDVVEAACDEVQSEVRRKGQTLHSEDPEPGWNLWVDPALLQSVLAWALRRAVGWAPWGADLRVLLEPDSVGCAVWMVTDTAVAGSPTPDSPLACANDPAWIADGMPALAAALGVEMPIASNASLGQQSPAPTPRTLLMRCPLAQEADFPV